MSPTTRFAKSDFHIIATVSDTLKDMEVFCGFSFVGPIVTANFSTLAGNTEAINAVLFINEAAAQETLASPNMKHISGKKLEIVKL